jgi:3-phenylpropionate/trans-cinnamate dioxygenase ferredoxin reductase subunit
MPAQARGSGERQAITAPENKDLRNQMLKKIVIAGAGHAAGQTAISLRQGGYKGSIIIVGEEKYLPYQRPALSKKFLAGEVDQERLLVRHEKFYAEHAIEMHLSTRVEAIDRSQHIVALNNDEHLSYDSLVLALGSHVRRLDLPGRDLAGIHYMRTLDDSLALQADFRPGARLVVIGAGYVGLEVAATAASAGLKVTVLEVADRVMSRVVAPPVSEFFDNVHRKAGVDIRCGEKPPTRFVGQKKLESVQLADGSVIPADLAVVGVGVLPTVDIAEAAGLECDNGIVVDDHCRTSDPDIFAVGDCTNHPNAFLGRRVRLESVHNAQEQAKTAAAALCGTPQPYAQVPWFWSDQYDLKLQIVGMSDGYDQAVIRGNPETRAFAVFYLQDERLIATDAINSPREFMLSKKLIPAGARFDPEILADEEIPFKELATAALA